MTRNKNHNGRDLDFVTRLRKRKRRAENKFKVYKASSDGIQTEFNSLELLKNQLGNFFGRITQTNELAKLVILSLNKGKEVSGKVAKLGRLNTLAIQILMLNTKKAAQSLDKICDEIVDLKSKIDGKIENSTPILQALDKVETKAKEALNQALDTLSKTFDAVKQADQLWFMLGKTDPHMPTGIPKILEEMYKIITSDHEGHNIRFPREDCPDDYYDLVCIAYNEAKEELDGTGDKTKVPPVSPTLADKLEEALGKTAVAESYKNSLTKALESAEKANAC